jgi:Ran GTPase-activating protein (RanGAP) involved in mRNA processing and transport
MSTGEFLAARPGVAKSVGGKTDVKPAEAPSAAAMMNSEELEQILFGLGSKVKLAVTELKHEKDLTLDHSALTDDEMEALAACVEVNRTLTRLSLAGNSITGAGVAALSKAMGKASIKELGLSANAVDDDGLASLGLALRRNACLRTLHLDHNEITDAGVVALAEGLGGADSHSQLQVLNLSMNQITDRGASTLAALLDRRGSIIELDLAHNRVTDVGASVIAASLARSTTLAKLDLSGGHTRGGMIGAKGATALANALNSNRSLHTLLLRNNQIDDQSAAALGDACTRNKTLADLALRCGAFAAAALQSSDAPHALRLPQTRTPHAVRLPRSSRVQAAADARVRPWQLSTPPHTAARPTHATLPPALPCCVQGQRVD